MNITRTKPFVYLKSLSCLSGKDRLKTVLTSLKADKSGLTLTDAMVAMDTFQYVLTHGGNVRGNSKVSTIIFKDEHAENEAPLKINLRKDTSDFLIFNEVFKSHGYYDILKLLLPRRQEPLNIIDAGANIGCTSLWLSAVFPHATIVSVEADLSNYQLLHSNIALNGKKNIHPIHNAFWHNNDELNLSTGFRDGREYAISVLPELDAKFGTVKGITMDDICKQFGFKQVDVLKLDIEGAEKYLFQDLEMAKALLERVGLVAIEIHEDIVDKELILQFFSALGYKHYQVTDTTYATR
jgi:FkbM family methyltransferase